MDASPKRPRLSIDVSPAVWRRLRLAAAQRDLLEAIEDRLREDLGDEIEGMLALTAVADPALAALWDNRQDAAYDRL